MRSVRVLGNYVGTNSAMDISYEEGVTLMTNNYREPISFLKHGTIKTSMINKNGEQASKKNLMK